MIRSAAAKKPARERLTVHQRHYRQLLRSAKRQSDQSKLESVFDGQVLTQGITGVVRNYKFHPDRKWELDHALPLLKLAVEIQGGIYGSTVQCNHCQQTVMRQLKDGTWIPVRQGMGHSTGTGIQRDIDKLNAAHELGWVVILLSGKMVMDGSGAALFKRFTELRSAGKI